MSAGPRGMPLVDVDGWTFGRFVDEIGERFGEREAMVASDRQHGANLRRWTYAELARDARALQWALQRHGIQPGDRVGVMLSSFPEWVLYLFAITRLGAVFVPINPRFRSRELRHVLAHSGARALVAMGSYLGHDYAGQIAEACGRPSTGGGYDQLPALDIVIGVHTAPSPAALDTAALLDEGRRQLSGRKALPRCDDAAALAVLFYTSGTTSFPKGVPLTHAHLLPHSVRSGRWLELSPGERVLTLYPFFGISGGANKVLSTLGAGACLVFQDSYRPEEAAELLRSQACAVIHGVDVQIRELMAAQGKNRQVGAEPEPPRRATIAFTAGLDEALARAMGPGLGIYRFIHAYGMTETNPMILYNRLDDDFAVSVRAGGRVAEGVEVRIVEPESGRDRPAGEEGEIVVRGSTVMHGYYNDPGATAAAFRDGWFHTGDLGVRTAGGFLFYVGRLKDMLKVGGFNVAPQEVEGLLRTHEAIEDVAVAPASDPRLGEVPVAFVKLRPGMPLSADELIAWSRERIANFKAPRAVYFVDALPYHTAANGSKLQRHVLRDWARQREAPTS
ncbi:MAG: class I adenylate-forming enzyme family protein [Pigmentiphaga sp.]|uniref:class I adenylate-forming enzyme family protein n=1 Tax=Pigmentiphaga sp. TaxID=1977564 RepID=UPI0029AB8235|nr:class I adenylate-forming enzyme family protein [Pigmentiphaga sp.]MDX3906603.1 class I adenylate-forming enzyme family protein [Pigmentiphaga sp.]